MKPYVDGQNAYEWWRLDKNVSWNNVINTVLGSIYYLKIQKGMKVWLPPQWVCAEKPNCLCTKHSYNKGVA